MGDLPVMVILVGTLFCYAGPLYGVFFGVDVEIYRQFLKALNIIDISIYHMIFICIHPPGLAFWWEMQMLQPNTQNQWKETRGFCSIQRGKLSPCSFAPGCLIAAMAQVWDS